MSSSPTERLLSVVAVNYNGGDLLERFVRSVLTSEPRPLELIVVDNDSEDSSVERLRGFPEVRVIASDVNLGFGRGCNAGAEAARGDLLVFANPDIELETSTLGRLVDDLLAAPGTTVSFPSLLERGGWPHERESRLEEVATMAGALMLVTREHFELLGGFDDDIFLYYEDADFCWRSWLAGGRVVKDWDAVARHDAHGSGGGPRWAAEQIRNGLYVHVKLRAWPAVARFAASSFVKTVARGLQSRDAQILLAWPRAAVTVRPALRARRQIFAAAGPDRRARLEALCAEHDYWRRRARAERWKVLGLLRRGSAKRTQPAAVSPPAPPSPRR